MKKLTVLIGVLFLNGMDWTAAAELPKPKWSNITARHNRHIMEQVVIEDGKRTDHDNYADHWLST